MRILTPQALRRGDVIGICAPASALASSDALDAGVRYIEQLGYRVEPGKHLFKKRGYLAGTDEERISDIHQLFGNKMVKAIFAARGGYGAHRIIAKLDYALIRRNPKILVGYSDITALQLAIFARAGVTSVSGAVVAELPGTFKHRSEEMFWQSLTSTRPLGIIRGSANGFAFARSAKIKEGRILGGNLSLVAGLMGTRYFPSIGDLVLLLEEIDERPYRIDRTLQQMKLNGIFDRARGVVLGSFVDCTPVKGRPSLRLGEIFGETFRDLDFPVVAGLRYGHLRDSLTIPLGVPVRADGKRNLLEFLGSAVG